MDLARSHAMILTSPSPHVSPQDLHRAGCVSVSSTSLPLTQDLPVPKTFPFPPPSVPLSTMIDTDITSFTLLPNYIKLDFSRLHAMILTSPPPLPRFKRLGRVGVVSVLSASHPQSSD